MRVKIKYSPRCLQNPLKYYKIASRNDRKRLENGIQNTDATLSNANHLHNLWYARCKTAIAVRCLFLAEDCKGCFKFAKSLRAQAWWSVWRQGVSQW